MEKGKTYDLVVQGCADSEKRRMRPIVFARVLSGLAAMLLAMFACLPATQAFDRGKYFAPTEHVFFYGQKNSTLIRNWSDDTLDILTPDPDREFLKELRKAQYPTADRVLLDVHCETTTIDGGCDAAVQYIDRYVFAGDELLATIRDEDIRTAIASQDAEERLALLYKRIDGEMGATSIDLSVPKGRKSPKPYQNLVKQITKKLYADKKGDLTAQEEVILHKLYPQTEKKTRVSDDMRTN